MRSIAILLLVCACTLILASCKKCPDCAAQCAAQCEQQAELKRAEPDDLGVSTLTPDTVHQIDRVFIGSSGWRTWAVFRTEPDDFDHMRIGHAFRLQRTGDGARLIPLAKLRGDWGKQSGFYVGLEKNTVNAATNNYRYCGKVKLNHKDRANDPNEHEHGIRIIYESADLITVQFYEPDDPRAPDARTLEQLCPTNKIHGGSAHAEN